jgi:uncharacterized membrane protein YkoI
MTRTVTRIGWAAALACAALAGCAQTKTDAPKDAAKEAGEHELHARDVAGEAKISLVDAIRAAHAARAGTVVEAELEGEIVHGTRSVFYEVSVVSGADVLVVKVDPVTGKVTSVEPEDEADEAKEMRERAAALPPGTHGLGDYVLKGEARTPGARAVKAAFELEHGALNCEVKFLKDGKIVEVDVDPAHPDHAGKPAAAEKHGESDDDDDDDDEADEKAGHGK